MAISSGVRSPRAWISLSGTRIYCKSASVTMNATGSSSSFSAEVPLDLLLANGWTMASLASQKEISGSIYISNDIAADATGIQMIQGVVDDIEIHIPEMSVSITGRDLSAKMHNNINTTQYLNQSSSQIVQTIAGNYGLSVSGGGSSGMVGRQYTRDFVKMFDGESDWSAVRALAEIEGFAVYIKPGSSSLYFGQPGQNGSYSVNYQPPTPDSPAAGDFLELHLHRDLNLGGTVTSTASAFDPHSKMSRKSKSTCAGNDSNTLGYDCRAANMTQEQLEKLAKSKVFTAVRHEMEIDAELVGDNKLVAGMSLRLSGTQSAFDNSYAINSACHEVNDEGYTMTVMARAMSPGRTISTSS